MTATVIRPQKMNHSEILNPDRTVCPLYERHNHTRLCNYGRCYDADADDDRKNNTNSASNSMKCTRKKEKTIHFKNIYSTYNEYIQKNGEDQSTKKCISLKPINTLKIIYHKFQNSSQICLTQSIGNILNQQQRQTQTQQKQLKPASKKTKETKVNTIKSSFASCLLCNKLQQPQVTKSNLSCFIFFTLIKMFPLLISSARSIENKRVKEKRQEVKSKASIRLLITLFRLLYVLQITTASVPAASAIENTVSQEQSQYSNSPPSIALFFNENTTTTTTATAVHSNASTQDFQVKNLVSKSHELSVVASSPAPVLAPFLAPGQTPSLTPVDSRIISFVNRDNILKQFQQQVSSAASNNPATESTFMSPSSSSSCSTCQLRKAKNDSLESIKLHILSKLRLKESPKIEVPLDVPQNIVKDYYRRFDKNGRRRPFKSTSASASAQVESRKLHDTHEDYMQSDDPNAFYDAETLYDTDDDEIEENEDEVYSHVKSTYIFPTTPRIRHNKRTDLLSFRYETTDETTIMRTILHLYIRGWKWIAEHEPDLFKRLRMNSTMDKTKDVVFTVHRALRRGNSSNYTHTIQMAESRQHIPTGLGNWIQIDLKDMADFWLEGGEPHQVVVIKTPETWMRHFVVTGIGKSTNNKNERKENAVTAHIEVRTERKPGRHRRSTSLDCQESDNEVRCCRYPLKVNFTSFGWSFVVAPTYFDAYFCNGECKLGYLEQYTHTHIASLSRSASPCCSPTKMSSLALLYFNLEQNLVLSTIPNMTVEKCSCS